MTAVLTAIAAVVMSIASDAHLVPHAASGLAAAGETVSMLLRKGDA